MNRETKRMMQRQGQDPEGEAPPRRAQQPARRPTKREPFSPRRFSHEVRQELRQVAWPSRAEVINYTTVTLATLVLLIVLIFLLNFGFSKAIFWLFAS